MERRNQTLKPRLFQVLLALADQDRHGSDIVREVLNQTDGELRLWPAMLYGTLDQLVAEGLIDEMGPDERPPGASAKRRYFRITQTGREVVADEAERLAALAKLARSKVVLSEKKAT